MRPLETCPVTTPGAWQGAASLALWSGVRLASGRPGFHPRVPLGAFPRPSPASDTTRGRKVLQWPSCQAPGAVGSALELVGPVSVYGDWVAQQASSATSISVWQHAQLGSRCVPEIRQHVTGALCNQQTTPGQAVVWRCVSNRFDVSRELVLVFNAQPIGTVVSGEQRRREVTASGQAGSLPLRH